MAIAYFITGATGVQGGAAARDLLKAGAEVRVLVRDASKPAAKELEALGAVLVVGDLQNEDAIRKGIKGVKGVFLNPFPDHTDRESERKQVQRVIDAALETGSVDTLVVSTVTWVAQYESSIANHPNFPMKDYVYSKYSAEQAVKKSGVKYWTILRPPWLLHNFFPPGSSLHFPELAATGEVLTCIDPKVPFDQLAGPDIGRFAAAALLEPEKFHGKDINLAVGAFTVAEAYRELEAVVGINIPVKFVDPQTLTEEQASQFSPIRRIAGQEMTKHGKLPDEFFQLQKEFGIKLTGLRDYFEEHKAELSASLPSTK